MIIARREIARSAAASFLEIIVPDYSGRTATRRPDAHVEGPRMHTTPAAPVSMARYHTGTTIPLRRVANSWQNREETALECISGGLASVNHVSID